MKKLLVAFLMLSAVAKAQISVGVSAFLPKDGTYASPVSPLSIGGLGVVSGWFHLSTGITMYHMSSAGLTDLPFDAGKSAIARSFSTYIPLEIGIEINLNDIKVQPLGGVFGLYSFGNKIDHGVFDPALAKYKGYSLLNGSSDINNKVGWGYYYGMQLKIKLDASKALVLGTNYLVGKSPMDLSGSYNAYDPGTAGIVNESFSFENTGLNFTGWEFSIGVAIKN